MKNSTILIVAGIVVLIFGGIVLMNSFQKESDGSSIRAYNADGSHRYAVSMAKEAIEATETNYQSKNTARVFSLIIIVVGIIMIGIGLNESHHSLSQKNIKPPEVHN